MIWCILCSIRVYHVFPLFAYPLERMWCMGNIWRPDDSDHHLSPLGWRESALRKYQNLPILLLELPHGFGKSKKLIKSNPSRPTELKYQSGRELIVSHHLFGGFRHNEASSVCPRAALWSARLSPSLAENKLPPANHTISSTACQIRSSTWKEYPS